MATQAVPYDKKIGEMVLEVKFTGKLPENIRRIFKSYALNQCSASKYCLCVDGLEHILQH